MKNLFKFYLFVIFFSCSVFAASDQSAANKSGALEQVEEKQGEIRATPVKDLERYPASTPWSGEHESLMPSFFSKLNFRTLLADLPERVEIVRTRVGLPIAYLLLVASIIFRLYRANDMRSFIMAYVVPMSALIAVMFSSQLSDYCRKFGDVVSDAIYIERPDITATKMVLFGSALMPYESAYRDPAIPTAELRKSIQKNLARMPASKSGKLVEQLKSLRIRYAQALSEKELAIAKNESSKVASQENQIAQIREDLNNFIVENGLADIVADDKMWYEKVASAFGDGFSAVEGAVMESISLFFIGVSSILLYFSAVVILCMYMIMYLFIYMSASLLPVFIAMLAIPGTFQIGQRYVMEHLSLACWPIGWAVGHIATPVFFSLIAGFLLQILDADSIKNILISAKPSQGSWMAAFGVVVDRLQQDDFHLTWGVAFFFTFLSALLSLWVVFVSIFMPKLVNSCLGTAGNFVNSHALSQMMTQRMALSGLQRFSGAGGGGFTSSGGSPSKPSPSSGGGGNDRGSRRGGSAGAETSVMARHRTSSGNSGNGTSGNSPENLVMRQARATAKRQRINKK